MDTNNWRPAQGEPPPQQPPAMDAGDWRSLLPPGSRQRIVNKIMDALKRHLPFSGQEGFNELEKIAVRFEEKIYNAATSQSDYLRKISVKMLTFETKYQGSAANSLPLNPSGNNKHPPDPDMYLRPAQGEPPPQQPPAMDAGDWRSLLPPVSRQRIVNKIMDTLKRHLPFSGQELEILAVRFEEKIFNAATSQSDYLRKISLKMLTIETKSQGSAPNSLPLNPSGNNKPPPDPGHWENQINQLEFDLLSLE